MSSIKRALPLLGSVIAHLLCACQAYPHARGHATDSNLEIVPGSTVTAVNTGNHVQAHGAGYIEANGLYYMIGEDKTNGSPFQNINCYSSHDLVRWTFVNALLVQQQSGDLGPNRIVERPKVLYNAATKKYVMYLHIDSQDYSEAKVGVATSDEVCGDYTYHGSFRPLGQQSRDIGLFQDEDGQGYLMTEDRPNGLHITKLSDDYLDVASTVYTFSTNLESPAMIFRNGLYYIFGSYLTGWNFNDNAYATAESLSGPWTEWTNFAPSGSNTYDSQTTYVLQTAQGVMYMGDRWQPDNFIRCSYVSLPMELNGTSVTMDNNYEHWLPSTFQPGPTLQSHQSGNAELSNGARSVTCQGCENGSAAGYIGGPSNGAITFTGVKASSSEELTVQIRFLNGDSTQRFAKVTVNDGPAQQVAFVPTAGGDPGVSVLYTRLVPGESNTVKIEGVDGTWGPDVDRLDVPQF